MAFNSGLLIIFTGIFLISCNGEKTSERIPAGKIIQEHQLTKTGEWITDSGLVFSSYENNNSGAYLLVALNKKHDTILNYFGNCYRCFYDLVKFEGEYILQLNNAYQNPDHSGQYPELMPEQYFIDSMKYFKLDTVSFGLQPIKRLPDDSLISRAKTKYHLEGKFSMVHPPLKTAFTIAKDTLSNSQVYYEITTEYKLQKNGTALSIIPVFDSVLPPNKVGIFNNKITFNDDYIGCNASPMNAAGFCLYRRTYSRFTDTLKHYGLLRITNNELVIKDNDHHEIKSILVIPEGEEFRLNSDKEKELNAGLVSELRVDMFSGYGDYFITTFLPYEDEYLDSYPPLYRLDTVTWTLNPVPVFDKRKDKVNRSVPKGYRIFSEDFKKRMSDFFTAFEVLKTNNGYRLARKRIIISGSRESDKGENERSRALK